MSHYAWCARCRKQHRSGTKIYNDHKESLLGFTDKPKRRTAGEQYFDSKKRRW